MKHTGLFEAGYVKANWRLEENKTISFKTMEDCKKFATKIRFKFIAKIWCWLLNKESTRNFSFRKFSVETINKPHAQ